MLCAFLICTFFSNIAIGLNLKYISCRFPGVRRQQTYRNCAVGYSQASEASFYQRIKSGKYDEKTKVLSFDTNNENLLPS